MCVQILTDHRVQHGWCSRSDGVDVCHHDLFVYLFLCSLTEVRCLIGGYQAGTGTTQSGPSYIRSTRPLLMRRTKSSITYLWQEFVFTQTHNWVWGGPWLVMTTLALILLLHMVQFTMFHSVIAKV